MPKLFFQLLFFMMLMFCSIQASAEKLTRGVVAMHKDNGGNFISWRLLDTDPIGATYNILRDGVEIAHAIEVCNYSDATGTASHKYQIQINDADGNIIETSPEAQTWTNIYKTLKLQRPTGGSFSYSQGQLGTNIPSTDSVGYYTYYAQEASVADVDDDGEYEILVKWNNTAAHDNAHDGYTGNCILDCYRFCPQKSDETAELLWRVDLGKNIRTGSHYTQFMFYDFNQDGKAEMICKTAPGSIDGMGNYVSEAADDETIKSTDNAKDYRSSKGRILSGPEYLTVFDGLTGKAIHTIWYNPNRAFMTGVSSGYSSGWGDSYGNRGERFLACVAHLDGIDKPASAVMCRGYYTRAYLWAVDFDGSKLSTKWLHASLTKSRVEVTDANGSKTVTQHSSNTSGWGDIYTAYEQGCHSIACGDVDGDGFDEIMYGAAAIDHDGTLLYTTGLKHGDAHHLGDFFPDRPGLEFMMPHEDSNGWHVRDAATGELLIWKDYEGDNGRGMAGDIDSNHRGAEFWSAADYNVYNTNGDVVSSDNRPSYCFRIYWDGTLQDNLLDGGKIDSYNNGNSKRIFEKPVPCIQNGSKAYPVLSADLIGDWREEVIWCSSEDSCSLVICSSSTPTKYNVPSLMQDHLYRMSICWQNVAYNQPPHLSYYLPDLFKTRFDVVGNGAKYQQILLGESIEPIHCKLANCTSAMVLASYLNGTKIKSFGVPQGFTFTIDRNKKLFELIGTPEEIGTYEIVIRSSGDKTGTNLVDTLSIEVVNEASGINSTFNDERLTNHDVYDLTGRKISLRSHDNSSNTSNLSTRQLVNSITKKGVYIINRKKIIIK